MRNIVILVVILIPLLFGCSFLRTDKDIKPTPNKDGVIQAEVVDTNKTGPYELKYAKEEKSHESYSGNVNASGYANFEDTIDNLLDLVKE